MEAKKNFNMGLMLVVLFVITNLIIPAKSFSQNPVCVYCNTPLPNGVHSTSCPYYVNTSTNYSNSNSSGTYSPQVQLAHDILEPVIQGFFNWLFSEPTSGDRQEQQLIDEARQNEEYRKAREEFKKQVLAQITNAKGEYEKQQEKIFNIKKEEAAHDVRIKVLQGNAKTTIKRANCDAFQSLQKTKFVLDGISKSTSYLVSKDLETNAEKDRRLAEFTNVTNKDCPEIKFDIGEVTSVQPVSFQQMYYNYIQHQSDSIKQTLEVLNYDKVKNDKILEEKKQKVEAVTKEIEKIKEEVNSDNQPDDHLLREAMKELELTNNELLSAEELNNKMKEEIELKKKSVDALDKMRKLYDKDEENTPEKTTGN